MPSYSITTEQFKGPIDLLLNLIEEHKFSINEISLATVANQYLDYVKALPELPRHEAASFLVVASTLLLIKSKSLLPSLELTGEEEQSIGDLERRLKLYRRFKELSVHVQSLYGKNILYGREAFSGVSVGFVEPEGVDVHALYAALGGLIKILPLAKDIPEKTVASVIKLEDKINELCERVAVAVKTSFRELSRGGDKMTLIVSFLALLELVKRGVVDAKQEGSFSDIEVLKS